MFKYQADSSFYINMENWCPPPPSIKKFHLAVFMYSANWPFLKMVDIFAHLVLQFLYLNYYTGT